MQISPVISAFIPLLDLATDVNADIIAPLCK